MLTSCGDHHVHVVSSSSESTAESKEGNRREHDGPSPEHVRKTSTEEEDGSACQTIARPNPHEFIASL